MSAKNDDQPDWFLKRQWGNFAAARALVGVAGVMAFAVQV
jgi:hypothetical protein